LRKFGSATWRRETGIGSEPPQRAVLTILLATCEVTLDTATREGLQLSPDFFADLERLAQRTRLELEALADQHRASA